MNLYNIRTRDGVFIITKFDGDLNIVDDSVYEVTETECTCPAGARSSCRHRQMLPIFLAKDRVDSDWFYCYEAFAWFQPIEPLEDVEPTVEEMVEFAAPAVSTNHPPPMPTRPNDWPQTENYIPAPAATAEVSSTTVRDLAPVDLSQSSSKPLRRL